MKPMLYIDPEVVRLVPGLGLVRLPFRDPKKRIVHANQFCAALSNHQGLERSWPHHGDTWCESCARGAE